MEINMSEKHHLSAFLGSPLLGVAASYSDQSSLDAKVYICGVDVRIDNSLRLNFTKGHQFQVNDKVTIHLDNRTGISEYDADLHVYRCSYKGLVTQIGVQAVVVTPMEFELWYGNRIALQYSTAEYQHPTDERHEFELPITPLTSLPTSDFREVENKIGVLITRAVSQPHTTVLAFLSSEDDDIFLISLPKTFKSKLLKRDHKCYFAIDSRAVFTFTKQIEWNYTIIAADTYSIPKNHPLFEAIRDAFIQKNPWEVGFFSHPDIEMYHLKANKVICPHRR